MKVILLSLLLVFGSLAVAPVAAAEPCEVPGCNVVGALVCVAAHATDTKGVKQWLPDCLTQTA